MNTDETIARGIGGMLDNIGMSPRTFYALTAFALGAALISYGAFLKDQGAFGTFSLFVLGMLAIWHALRHLFFVTKDAVSNVRERESRLGVRFHTSRPVFLFSSLILCAAGGLEIRGLPLWLFGLALIGLAKTFLLYAQSLYAINPPTLTRR